MPFPARLPAQKARDPLRHVARESSHDMLGAHAYFRETVSSVSENRRCRLCVVDFRDTNSTKLPLPLPRVLQVVILKWLLMLLLQWQKLHLMLLPQSQVEWQEAHLMLLAMLSEQWPMPIQKL